MAARFCRIFLIVSVTAAMFGGISVAQEVASVDLRDVDSHSKLRRPAPKDNDQDASGGIRRLTDPCRSSDSYIGSLKTTLSYLDSDMYGVGDEPIFQVQLENVGSSPVELPFSPSLADLQPPDPSKAFSYSRMQLDLWILGKRWSASTGGTVMLFGNKDLSGTIITLRPGEWVRIIGKGRIALPEEYGKFKALGDIATRVSAKTTVYKDEMLLTATATATTSTLVCLHETHSEGMPVHIKER